tara:strand:+ start:145518 stop:146807 length:1290 start_codon:yes stop_codon:yes gene_type:complete
MSLPRLLDPFRLKSSGWVYGFRLIRNRVEFTADPERVKEFSKCPFTRSQMTMDMLTRFHLSNQSIVVSDDEHAATMRKTFRDSLPSRERFAVIAKDLVEEVLPRPSEGNAGAELHLSNALIRSVYISLLTHMLGVQVTQAGRDYVRDANIQSGSRPMQLDGIMYALGVVIPRWAPMRKIVEVLRGDHHTRRIAADLEKLIFEDSVPSGPDTWYANLLRMKSTKKISGVQFRGELTSMLVSSFSLSAAMSSMLLCVAARPEYVSKIRKDPGLAKCFVNEVLRLYPPFRQFGYEHKGVWDKTRTERAKLTSTDLMLTIFALHRNGAVWNTPNEFRPERFLSSKAAWGRKYLPFGMGKRACSGRLYSEWLLCHVLMYICSEECQVTLGLPDDFAMDSEGLPVGLPGRLISFPEDDRIILQAKHPCQDLAGVA